MSPENQELELLLIAWEHGELDDEGVERVREILRDSESAREFYVQFQLLNAAMTLESGADVDSEVLKERKPNPVVASPTSAHVGMNSWVAFAATLMICLLGGRVLYQEYFAKPDKPAGAMDFASKEIEETSSGVALVTQLVDVQWSDNQDAVEVGDALSPGVFAIKSGFAQIEFFCGATVIVEGPAELDLKSTSLAQVKQGRLRAQVPPAARGFSLEIEDIKVVDLGTEFGVSVSPGGADVQVFDGEVELVSGADEKKLLIAGEAVTRTSEGGFKEIVTTPKKFVDISSMEKRANDQQSERFQSWKQWSNEFRADSRLIAYYGFGREESWNRKLESDLLPNNDELDGAIVGAKRVSGRWAAKSALEFKQPADRVRVNIDGEYSSLSFSCWVKIDSLDRLYNSLFLTDHYDQGEPHWQILETGQLFFSVRHKADDATGAAKRAWTHQPIISQQFWKPSMSGRWLHLATTYDANTGQTIHFLNGEVLHEEVIEERLRVNTTRIGAASIGNWSLPLKPDAEYAIRNLNGSMDEFAIFSAVLSPKEIKDIYENGKQ